MALKDLIVYLDQGERALLRLRLAAELARRHGGRLIAVYARGLSQEQVERRRSAELGLRSFHEMERLDHRMEDRIDGASHTLHSALNQIAQDRLSFDWREIDSTAIDTLTMPARGVDLCIVGQDDSNGGSSIGYGLGESLLRQKGRPVIFIPATGEFVTLGRNIVVGWDGSPTASRAATAALALIGLADSVTVLTVDPSEVSSGHDGVAAEPLVEQLRQQGTHAVARTKRCPAGIKIADAVQSEALELGADLIVAGAYGHARLREKLIGGVTRDLLASMKLPLMMAH